MHAYFIVCMGEASAEFNFCSTSGLPCATLASLVQIPLDHPSLNSVQSLFVTISSAPGNIYDIHNIIVMGSTKHTTKITALISFC